MVEDLKQTISNLQSDLLRAYRAHIECDKRWVKEHDRVTELEAVIKQMKEGK